jgi:hypothetical protein
MNEREEFIKMIKEVWAPYDGNLRQSTPTQFQQNLRRKEKKR